MNLRFSYQRLSQLRLKWYKIRLLFFVSLQNKLNRVLTKITNAIEQYNQRHSEGANGSFIGKGNKWNSLTGYPILWKTLVTSSSCSSLSISLLISSACSSLTGTVLSGIHSSSALIGVMPLSSSPFCSFPKSTN